MTTMLSGTPSPAEALCAMSAADERLYATLDLANLRKTAAAALDRLRYNNGICLLGDLRQEAQLASPWLVEVAAHTSAPLLHWTLELARQHSAVTWMHSPLAPFALAHRLRARTETALPDGEAMLLRYFDPRVLPALESLLEPAQRASYLAVGSAWFHLDRGRTLLRIELAGASSPDPFAPPLRLTDKQFSGLLHAAEVDSVMPELVRQVPQTFLAMPAADRVSFTRRWLARADELKLTQHPDRVALCVLAARLEDGFDKRPPWAELLQAVQGQRITLAQAMDRAMEEKA
ncbi:DUF4123 domain-containing protein [Ideonella sp. BN130291]|uniref:DUF4123 domain-containing protein n=1 Tax=Ideonella sp. BN130291 TaxID=3112940 RepID=UPI002E276E42|nr:DUF4123 domain-containing protein [Ideonella sp. BN130291]